MIVQDLKSRNIFMSIQGKTSSDTTAQLLEDFVPLYGVTRLSIQWQHDIGARTGLTANFLQPWYNKPVEIEIQGESYIGMYGGQTISSILAQQQADKKKQTNILDTINKGLKSVGDAIVQAGKSVLDSIKFPTALSLRMQGMKLREIVSTYNIDWGDISKFLGVDRVAVPSLGDLPMWKVLEKQGKTADEFAKFLANNCEQWGKKNLPSFDQRENLTKSDLIKNSLSDAVRKALSLLKQSLGPKEDKTVYNLKRLISYYRSGPFNYKGANYKNLTHIMLIENEQGMGEAKNTDGSVSGQSDFSTFVGFIRDFSYTESVENPFVYDYTVRFIGLPDTGDILRQSSEHAKIDESRGGITVTVNSTKDILSQGLGLLKTIATPSIPKIPGL